MFGVGFVAMALIVWLSIAIAYRSRPVYVKLNSQLDRYQQVVEPLRRLAMYGIPLVLGVFLGVSTATRWTTVLQYLHRTPVRPDRPAVRARRLVLRLRAALLPRRRRLRVGDRCSSPASPRSPPATCTAASGSTVARCASRAPPASSSPSPPALYLALQAVSIWFDQYATLTDDGAAHHRRRVHRRQRGHPRPRHPGRHRRAGRRARPRHRHHRPLAPAARSAPRCSSCRACVIGSIYPAIIQRFQVEPSARTLEAEYIDSAIDATREAYGVDDEHVDVRPYAATTDAEAGRAARRRRDDGQHPHPRPRDRLRHLLAAASGSSSTTASPTHLDVDRYDDRRQDAGHRHRGARTQPAPARAPTTGSATPSSTRTASASSPPTATSARPTGSRCSSSPASRRPATSATSSRASTSARTRPKYSIVGGSSNGEPAELDYPSGRRGQRQRQVHDVRRRRRAEARQRLQASRLRDQVPVRAGRAVEQRHRRLAGAVRPQPAQRACRRSRRT